MAEPNVLLLDEPTNDLDVDTLAHLEDLLDGWPGTLVVVSHDRYLVERACDTVVALFGDGRITHLPGGIDEYLARRAAAGDAVASTAVQAPAATPRTSGLSAAEQRAARKEAQRLERRMETLSAREEKLHAQLAEAATDPDRLLALDAELRAVVGGTRAGGAGLARGGRARRVVDPRVGTFVSRESARSSARVGTFAWPEPASWRQ